MKSIVPLKITYVYYHMAYTGGIVRVLSDKMNYLANNGFNISLITYEQGEHPITFPLNANIQHYDTRTPLFPLYHYNICLRIFKQFKIQKVFRHRLQLLVDQIDPDIIITIAGDQMSCNAVTKLSTNARRIIESHSINFETMNGIQKKRRNILFKVYDLYRKKTISKFDALVALTHGSANEWKNIISTVYVIPNPITKYPEIGIDSSNYKRIIAVGRLDYEKGFNRLITAFSLISENIPDWRLDIYGEGKEKDNLLSLILSYSLKDQVEIHQPTSDIYNEYMKSGFCVVSSYYEGWGLVLVEAMSCGIPCVSFNCKYGPKDIITDKIDGLLVKDGDINDLAEKMLWMCQHHETRLEMGKRSRIKSSEYTKDVIMPKWLDLFMTICKK